MENRPIKIPIFFVVLLLVLAVTMLIPGRFSSTRLSSAQLEALLEDHSRVAQITISPSAANSTADVEITYLSGDTAVATVPDAATFAETLSGAGISYTMEAVSDGGAKKWLPYLIVMAAVLFFLPLLMNRFAAGGMNARMADFSRSRARLAKDNKITFRDVAGMTEEKEELEEIVEFLKNPKRFREMGARIPKGVILVGSPGTGKTLLGKAIAGEANVPFYSISGSDFVEMYVGVGAARVRDMFEEAKKNSPCIVFIDEIDAVARRRGTGLGGSHDEREQTLNQLLVEMDGFDENLGIIVLAATNRADILDPAIMRPGRFDRKVTVGRPDVKAREAILRLHAQNKHLDSASVDLVQLAKTTAGFTGADLENLLNEAAINATMKEHSAITAKDIEEAFIKIGIGKEKRSKTVSERDRRITAYHESGHAILFHLLEDVGPVHLVSIIPTGEGAGGYTMPLPDSDDSYVTKGQLKHMMMAAMGGRIAEELVCDDITTGASQDIRQVTSIARAMVTRYGMSEKVGMLNYDENGDDVFLGYDIAHNKTYGDRLLSEIDAEVKALVDECYAKAKELILAHRDVLERASVLLLEKEKLTGEEFDALF